MNSTLKAGLILFVVFAIGVTAGVTGFRLTHKPPPRSPSNDPYRQDPTLVDRIERRLVEHYDLTEEQRVAVRQILKDSQKKYDDFFRDTRPTFEQIRRDQREAIRAIMTPEQVVAFEAWIEERRKNRPNDGGPGRDGGPRPPHGPRPQKKPPSEDAPSNN
jgi:Spy/CpxP family protein refolding chaperone